MENSLNIPSSPSLPYFYTLQTSPWLILANSASWLLVKSPEIGKGCPQITTPLGAHLPLSIRTQSSSSEENEVHLGTRACWRWQTLVGLYSPGGSCPAWGDAGARCPSCPGLWAAQPSPATCRLPGPPPGLQKHKFMTEDSFVGFFNFLFFFLKLGVSHIPPEPLDGAVFCTQNCFKINSNLEWESTMGMHMFCLQDSYNIYFPKMEFYSFFLLFDTTTRSGVSNGVWKCKYKKVLTALYI